jgi:hypothetical protein
MAILLIISGHVVHIQLFRHSFYDNWVSYPFCDIVCAGTPCLAKVVSGTIEQLLFGYTGQDDLNTDRFQGFLDFSPLWISHIQ